MACIVAVAAMACERLTEPEFVIPKYDMPEGMTLISIADLKAMHTIGEKPTFIGDSLVICGVVVGDDESGNIYKSIYLQDATGGLNLAIDNVNMYNTMPVGQRVYVELKGMFIGDYAKSYQLGDTVTDPKYGLEMARYNWANELRVDSLGRSMRHFYPDSLPDLSQVPAPKVLSSSNEITSDIYGSLVTLKNITLKDAEKLTPWATKEQTVNRTAVFADGSTLIIRTSGYCNFYADYMPEGTGNITGILSIYNTTPQLTIRSREDIGTFVED